MLKIQQNEDIRLYDSHRLRTAAQSCYTEFMKSCGQLADSNLRSRVHPFQLDVFGQPLHLKREDELGFVCSGTKARKIASLRYMLAAAPIQRLFFAGGINGNSTVALLQLGRELGCQIQAFLTKTYAHDNIGGNELLNRGMLRQNEICWVERSEIVHLHRRMLDSARQGQGECLILPEGMNHFSALPGAMSLADDVIRNERQMGFPFSDIFIDAGTGLAAIGLLLGLSRYDGFRRVHIIDIGGCESHFADDLDFWRVHLRTFYGIEAKPLPPYRLYRPALCKSFGATNRRLLNFVMAVLRETGVVIDPVYNGKAFYTVASILAGDEMARPLLIHSGGGSGFFGFSRGLQSLLGSQRDR